LLNDKFSLILKTRTPDIKGLFLPFKISIMKRHSLAKDQIKILLLEGIHESGVKLLKENGYTNIESYSTALNNDELISKIKDVHMIGIRSRTELTKEVLKHAKKLIAIGCFSIGTNQVDKKTAKSLGIPVFNAPFSNTRSVAELVISESIMLLRSVPKLNSYAHQGKWLKTAKDSYEIRGKTIGIIGYGHIGSQVSILAEGMGMKVIFFDIEKKLTLGNAIQCKTLQEVMKVADIITLHVPSTKSTKEMVGAKEIAMMKRGSLLINASRGDVVEYNAVAEALKSGHLLGAAVDVYPKEPASNSEPFKFILQGMDNVILTPHVGGSTSEAQENIGIEVAEKMVQYSDIGSTLGSVNFPQISLTPNKDLQRFLHIHKNQPGVMQEVNSVFSNKGINIASVYLQTDPEIGYVIIDTESQLDDSIIKELKDIDHTIKARMLY
jgi:D-3-phosphoglycerate dehydrogenase